MLGRADLTEQIWLWAPAVPSFWLTKRLLRLCLRPWGVWGAWKSREGITQSRERSGPPHTGRRCLFPVTSWTFLKLNVSLLFPGVWPGAWGFRRACNDKAPLWGWGWPFPGSQRKKSLCDRMRWICCQQCERWSSSSPLISSDSEKLHWRFMGSLENKKGPLSSPGDLPPLPRCVRSCPGGLLPPEPPLAGPAKWAPLRVSLVAVLPSS